MTNLTAGSAPAEAEGLLVGALLLDADKVPTVRDVAGPEHFENHELRTIYRAILDVTNAGRPVDFVAVTEALGVELAAVGYERLVELAKAVTTSELALYHAHTVRERFAGREFEDLSKRAADRIREAPAGTGRVYEEIANTSTQLQKLGEKPQGDYVPFPVEVFPSPLGGFVSSVSASIGCDPCLVAVPLLVALAGAIGNSRVIELKPGWWEPSILWAVIVADSGELKSPAQDKALEPIRKLQRKWFRAFMEQEETYKADKLKFDRELKHWKGKVGDDDPPPEPPAPVLKRLSVSDVTVEALARVLRDNPHGVILDREELAGWVEGFDKYRGGKGGDASQWLEVFGGRSIIVDRVDGRGSPVIYVPRASVSITGGIQPGTLSRLMESRFLENGLAARLLVAHPPKRPRRWTEASVPEEMMVEITDLVRHLHGLAPEVRDGEEHPVAVRFTPAGKERWVQFYNEHATEQGHLSGALASAWSKLEGYAARFSLVLHCVREALEETSGTGVEADTVDDAVELTRWFAGETLRVYREQYGVAGGLAQRLERIRQEGGMVSVREWQRMRSLDKAKDAKSELRELEEAGLGRVRHIPPGPKGGPRSTVFELTPDKTDRTDKADSYAMEERVAIREEA